MMATSVEAQDVDGLRRAVEPVMRLSDAEVLELIPHRAGIYFVGCPNCDGGTQENQISWSIERPHEVFCRFCQIRYPNDQYPEDQSLRVTNARGEIHEYPYWDDADGYHHFFQAKGWYVARAYFEDTALRLGLLYEATGEEQYAARAALILRRFAEVYPGYLVHYDYPFRQKILWSGEDDFPYPVPDYRAAKWTWWAYKDISEDLLRAYELVRYSEALDEVSKQRIENDLFRGMVSFVYNYPPALTNMDPTLLRGLITAGRVLGEPDYMHEAVRRIGQLVSQQFFADGVWREGAVSYHNQTVRGLDILVDLLNGYSDPAGYRNEDGTRFDDLDLAEELPILQRARRVPGLLRYPNGRTVAFHDTWAREGSEPLPASTSVLLPELGHARLGRGVGDGQIQTHLHFSGGYGHQHYDVLAMTLFAAGQERLGDIGYTHTRYRLWTRTTLSHNTVTVDGRDQQGGHMDTPSDGSLTLFVPGDADMLAAVEADGARAYPELDLYRRMLVQIGAGADAYVVDLFRVKGGSRHDYVLTGDADHQGELTHQLAARPYGPMLLPADVEVRLPTGENTPGETGGHNIGYAFLRDVSRVEASGPWQMTFRSEAPAAGAVRVHGALMAASDVLYTTQAPSIRQAQEDDGVLDDFTMPVLVHRRESEGDLSSTFVTVLEAIGAQGAFIDTVERLSVDVQEGEGVAVQVTWGSTVDVILIGSDPATRVRIVHDGDAEGIEMVGRLGFVRRQGDRVTALRLAGGAHLKAGDETLTAPGLITGEVSSTRRRESGDASNALLVEWAHDQPTPGAAMLEGRWAIVIDGAGFHHGHQIVSATPQTTPESGGQMLLELQSDPGYTIDAQGGRMHYFPGRTWTKPSRIEIATVVASDR